MSRIWCIEPELREQYLDTCRSIISAGGGCFISDIEKDISPASILPPELLDFAIGCYESLYPGRPGMDECRSLDNLGFMISKTCFLLRRYDEAYRYALMCNLNAAGIYVSTMLRNGWGVEKNDALSREIVTKYGRVLYLRNRHEIMDWYKKRTGEK